MLGVHQAALEDDVDELRRLLDEDPGLMETADAVTQEKPLHVACYVGSMRAVGFLLDKGADIDCRNRNEETPLLRACEAGRAEVVSVLLDRGADPTLYGQDLWTALMCASYGCERDEPDYVAVIRLLLKDGRVPVDARYREGSTALWWACLYGFSERARLLLVEGVADHTIRGYDGSSALDALRSSSRVRPYCAELLQVRRRRCDCYYLIGD